VAPSHVGLDWVGAPSTDAHRALLDELSRVAGDLEHIAAHVREADRQELIAATGSPDVLATLRESVMLSSHYWISEVDEPLAVFGVAPRSLMGDSGVPWAIGTNLVLRFPGAMVREGRRYVARMLEAYSHLQNHVDARNTRSVRWLARLGFEIHPARPYGAAGLPFHRFEMRA
jgi:hypothetical protein